MNEQNSGGSNTKSQMRKGILEYCVLLILSRQRAYPSDIINILFETDFIVVEGTIYTLLNRLRKEGKLNYEWEESRQGPPRKYFFLTDIGKQALEELRQEWEEVERTINHIKSIETPPEFTKEDIQD